MGGTLDWVITSHLGPYRLDSVVKESCPVLNLASHTSSLDKSCPAHRGHRFSPARSWDGLRLTYGDQRDPTSLQGPVRRSQAGVGNLAAKDSPSRDVVALARRPPSPISTLRSARATGQYATRHQWSTGLSSHLTEFGPAMVKAKLACIIASPRPRGTQSP